MDTVLIIDDEWSIREVATMMLERAGYKAMSAASAEDGLSMLASNRFSAVLVDVILPDKNGLELSLEMNRRWPNIPIILMSGRVSTEADSIKNFNGHFWHRGFHIKAIFPGTADFIACGSTCVDTMTTGTGFQLDIFWSSASGIGAVSAWPSYATIQMTGGSLWGCHHNRWYLQLIRNRLRETNKNS